MSYNNLIYFLVVIFIFSTNTPPEKTTLSPLLGVINLLALPLLFYFLCSMIFLKMSSRSAGQYFKAEKKVSLLALLFFVFSVYGLNLKYFLQPLSFGDNMPVFVNFAGLCYFFVFLSVMWIKARKSYQSVFQKVYTARTFVLSNIRLNLPIVLPWLVITFIFDLLTFLSVPGLNKILESLWGEVIVFIVFVLFLALFFPPLIRKLWNCTPLPEGFLRTRLESFCHKNNFHSPLLLWPLFEGQVITAAIMGFVPGFRYLLVTPALLSTMTTEEIDSVLAHEIGHVRKKHLLLYLSLFFGFSILIASIFKPMHYIIYSSDFFYTLHDYLNLSVEVLRDYLLMSFMLVLMIVYFRCIFGYFIRNFERQADLYVFDLIGTPKDLINAFEKIATLSGNIRSKKSWHHFGIGERIDFLEKCNQDRSEIKKHNRKLYLSMGLYFMVLLATLGFARQINLDTVTDDVRFKYMDAMLQDKLKQEPENNQLLLAIADLLLKKDLEERAIKIYEKVVHLEPLNAEANNNLAWLLLTAKNKSLRDPQKALILAQTAIEQKEQGHIYDTLATALWVNGFQDRAIVAEMKAIKSDPLNQEIYQQQLQKFSRKRLDVDDQEVLGAEK